MKECELIKGGHTFRLLAVTVIGPVQTDVTLLANNSQHCCVRLHTLLYVVGCCCVLLSKICNIVESCYVRLHVALWAMSLRS